MPKKRPLREPKKLTIDVIEARSFVLIDDYGKPRVELSCCVGEGGKEGFTMIQINDDTGRPRLVLQVDPKGTPSIALFGSMNDPGISMAVNEELGRGISVSDAEGNRCISLGVAGPGSQDPRGPYPRIDVLDIPGKRQWSVFDGVYDMQSER